MARAMSVYMAFMTAIERRRARLGWPMWELDEKAGLSEGYYSKMLHAGSTEGRRASVETLEKVLDAMFQGAYILRFSKVRDDDLLSTARLKKINANLRTYLRHHMITIAPLGAKARVESQTPERRRAIARHAARVRWERHKQQTVTPP